MDIDLLGIFQDHADLARPGHCFPTLSAGVLTLHNLGPQTSILDADTGTGLVGTSLYDPDYKNLQFWTPVTGPRPFGLRLT